MVIETLLTTAVDVATTKAIEKTSSSLINKLSVKFAKDKYENIKIKLNIGLPSYLTANYAKCQTIKTLLNRNNPVQLEDCFVAPKFLINKKTCSSEQLLNQINEDSKKVIITGLAGSGKTIFLKYAFKKLVTTGQSYYPFFYELRLLNRRTVKPGMLLDAIYESISTYCPEFTRTQLEYGLKSGAFYFLLDGFDEISQEIREQISEEILIISRKHSKCAVLVSSRPADEFVAWEGFVEASLLPFDLDQSTDYIRKLDFDNERKQDFISDLQAGLFEKNRDFLSNPLLAAMMLLTYDSYGEIPEKRHIFYSKCFDVLAREHDSSKGRYKRELFSKLTMDQLERAFMFFCSITYVEREFSFTSDQMRKFVTEATAACGIVADIDDVIKDFRESISIIELDGLVYEFAHRSFQEYFYAKFVITDRKLKLDSKINWLISGFSSDDAVEMIADMDRIYFEDEYLLPKVKKLNTKLEKIDPIKKPSSVLSLFFSRIHTDSLSEADRQNNAKSIYYTHLNPANMFLFHAAYKMFKIEMLSEFEQTDEEEQEKFVMILEEKYGGEIKIHHQNNEKLREVGVHNFADRLKCVINKFTLHLEDLQKKRKIGLGAMIKKNYSN